MKLRLTGTVDECAVVLAALRSTLDVREVSDCYPNRGDSTLVRVYVDAVPVSGTASLAVGQVLTASSPEPGGGSIVRGIDMLIWERDGDGTGPSWFRIDDDGTAFGDPESWTKVAGNYGPVFLDHLGDDRVTGGRR